MFKIVCKWSLIGSIKPKYDQRLAGGFYTRQLSDDHAADEVKSRQRRYSKNAETEACDSDDTSGSVNQVDGSHLTLASFCEIN